MSAQQERSATGRRPAPKAAMHRMCVVSAGAR
jgi:hypothetical protein